MNCLWLILILACCGGQSWGCDNRDDRNGCGCGVSNSRRGNRRSDNDCGCRGREDDRDRDCDRDRDRDRDCGCDDGPRRRSVSSMPSFGRSGDNETCGCENQDD